MMSDPTFFDTINNIVQSIKIEEGYNGVLRNLAVIERYPEEPMRKVAQESNLPVPICVAIRNELEKVGWVTKGKKGAVLTSEGQKVFNSISGLNLDFSCSKCKNLGITTPFSIYLKELENLKKYSDMRGLPLTNLDQSFATPRTSLSRIFFMSQNFDLIGKNFAFIGDSDLTSIALAMFAHESSRITVFDIDTRLKDIIELANNELNLEIEFVEHDFRYPIPKKYLNKYECILTDPPYTIHGIELFISRGISLLAEKYNGVGYLSFGSKPPSELLEIEKCLVKMNCVITHIIPNFNKYIGAQKIGGVSHFYRFEIIQPASPIIQDQYSSVLYTGDVNPIVRTYKCLNCDSQIEVGSNQQFSTIEELKMKKCPHCNHEFFTKISERKME